MTADSILLPLPSHTSVSCCIEVLIIHLTLAHYGQPHPTSDKQTQTCTSSAECPHCDVTLSRVSIVASSSKTGSRSKNQFSPSYIEQRTEDYLPDRVKGAAVWKSYPDTEGYYVWNNVLNKYIPLEYDKTTKVWATLAQDKQGRWYTVQPAPLEYSLGPY